VQAFSVVTAPPSSNEDLSPYTPFLKLGWSRRIITMVGAVAAVVAFGFVPVSGQMVGGSGWPLHDVLHPLLGLFLGPVYGPLSAAVGTAMSEVLSPHTTLNGWAPIAGGVSALTSALLVRRQRNEKGLWGGVAVVGAGGVWGAIVYGVTGIGGIGGVVLVGAALGLVASSPVRAWCRQHLTPSGGGWKTAVALYAVCFVGTAFGLVPLWGVTALGGTVMGNLVSPMLVAATRVVLPLVGALLGLALWPALQRRLFSVANQLRYGLPLFMLATFLFAGRLFLERAYTATKAETTERLRDQSQAVAHTLDTELERARRLLVAQARMGTSPDRLDFFQWGAQVSAGDAAALPDEVRALADRARRTGRPQYDFVTLPDTAGYGIGMAVPLAADGAQAGEAVARVVVGCVGPSVLQRTLAIWRTGDRRLYLVNRRYDPVVEREGAPTSTQDPAPLLDALRAASGPTAEAVQGRYGTDVLGAIAPLDVVPGYVVLEQAQDDAYTHVVEMLLTMVFITLLACGGALAVGFYVSQRVVVPLDRLIDAARQAGQGNLSVRVAVEQENELGELARTFNTMTRDLSESIQRLQANEERLRIALDAAQMGTWNWTADSDTVVWSPQTYALLDVPRSREDHLLSAFLDRVHPEDQAQVIEQIRSVVRGKTSFVIEHRLQTDGAEDVRWMRLQGRVYRDDGQPQRMSGVIADITSQKQAELELKAAKEEAEEMSQLKSAFLANVSHEIRTPLTSILGFAEILVDEVSPAHQDGAEKILESGHRLMRTLDSVLDLSMIEAGEFSLDCRDCDVVGEVRQRVELLRPTAERKGLSLTLEAPDAKVDAHLDPNCLDRILTNLLTNAIKFTEDGCIDVQVRTDPDAVVVQVADTGVGISDEFQSDLFEAFKQESRGLQREHDGTGLGLSITKELVEMMQGDIRVESEKGAGTTFTVRLPYRVSEQKGTMLTSRLEDSSDSTSYTTPS
jgi:PAS domain S-box-containing protein